MHLKQLLSLALAVNLLTNFLKAQTTHVDFPELVIVTDSIAKQPRYNATAPLNMKVLHTQLDLRFDWEKVQVQGTAVVYVTPHFYPQDSLILDAKGFQIHALHRYQKTPLEPLKFTNDGEQLRIALDRTYTKADTLAVYIQYTATPDSLKVSEGRAIRSDKGLYFINPHKKDPNKPRQIWTQGEPESNSAWFPTIDKPNQRMTHQITLTVDTNMVTLSNGYRDFSVVNGDGTRTDFWVMDQPHAPYLAMLAVGEFKVVQDNGMVPIDYYMEPDYERYARLIFGETPEMITHFSDLLGVPYPWNKYSQVIVRDYVSGAMENTTAVIFGEFMNMDDKAHADAPMFDIVAHELFHHWFGDLVTCRSWANLPLNESFATYGEVLWREHKYGIDEADYQRENQRLSYLRDVQFNGAKDMIRFDYEQPDDMFDGHSYAKGGRILHMLRHELGDAAFFEGLKTYLTDNSYQAVEIHQLRQAFEKVTGRDLNPFFNQWFLAAGHPNLKVAYEWQPDAKNFRITINQTQDLSRFPLYQLKIPVVIYQGKQTITKELHLQDARQVFDFELKGAPDWVALDPTRMLLATWEETAPEEWALQRFEKGQRALYRLMVLQDNPNHPQIGALTKKALQDAFWAVREAGLRQVAKLEEKDRKGLQNAIEKMATSDPKPQIRALALQTLWQVYQAQDLAWAQAALQTPSYVVMSAGLQMRTRMEPQAARLMALDFKDHQNSTLRNQAWKTLAEVGNAADYDLMQQRTIQTKGWAKVGALADFGTYLSNAPDEKLDEGVAYLTEMAQNADNAFLRYYSVQGLVKIYERWEDNLQNKPMTGAQRKALPGKIEDLRKKVAALKAAETDPQVRTRYGL